MEQLTELAKLRAEREHWQALAQALERLLTAEWYGREARTMASIDAGYILHDARAAGLTWK